MTRTSDKHTYDRIHSDIHNKLKWEVNELLEDEPYKVSLNNGYFGSYSLIQYRGKQCIVYVDDRDAKVVVVTSSYDRIYYNNSWSGDYRWNSDKPVVVFDKKLGYNIIEPHCNHLLCEAWLANVDAKWLYRKDIGDYMLGTNKQGEEVIILPSGTVINTKEAESTVIQNTLDRVKEYSNLEVLDDWILQDKPCAHIRGLEYKGASARRVTRECAEELFKTHNDFRSRFNSVEWRVIDGAVCLLFRDYANSDYD